MADEQPWRDHQAKLWAEWRSQKSAPNRFSTGLRVDDDVSAMKQAATEREPIRVLASGLPESSASDGPPQISAKDAHTAIAKAAWLVAEQWRAEKKPTQHQLMRSRLSSKVALAAKRRVFAKALRSSGGRPSLMLLLGGFDLAKSTHRPGVRG